VTHPFARTLVLAAVLFGAAAPYAAAQNAPTPLSRSLVPTTFPRWDAGGSIGMLTISGRESRSSWADWEQKGEFRADVGRYWTTHLKTEVAFSTTNQWHDYRSEPFQTPGGLQYTYMDFERQLHTVAPAITWQFRENTFMHPFVSAGVNVGFLQEHGVREPRTVRSGAVTYTVPPFEERRTTVMARPFVAGGFKSYISRSIFVRTEGRVGFSDKGVERVTALAGIGVDF
jgi:hypothetical protein